MWVSGVTPRTVLCTHTQVCSCPQKGLAQGPAGLSTWPINQVAELTDEIQDASETWVSERQQMLFKYKYVPNVTWCQYAHVQETDTCCSPCGHKVSPMSPPRHWPQVGRQTGDLLGGR